MEIPSLILRISEWLQLRKGEGRPMALMLSFSLCLGVFGAFYFTVAYSQFLMAFESKDFPLAYLSAGVIGFFVVGLFSRARKRLAFGRLLLGATSTVMGATLLFGLVLPGSGRWVGFLMFASFLPLVTLLELSFWGLASKLFDLQQGKRLFGLISSGEALAAIFGALLYRLLFPLIQNPGFYLALAALALGLALWMVKSALAELPMNKIEDSGSSEGEPSLQPEGFPKPYFVLLSLVVTAFILTKFFVDFVFLQATRLEFPDGESLAAFLAFFYGLARFLELLTKSFVSGRLISELGVRAGLLTLPCSVLLCWALAEFMALGQSPASDLFGVVVLAKLFASVFQKSMFDPTYKLMFQPLPVSQRFAMQTLVDGRVRQVAVFLAGLILLGLSVLHWNGMMVVIQVSAVILVGWWWWTSLLHKSYRKKLVAWLTDAPSAALIQKPSAQLKKRLEDIPQSSVGYVLDFLEHVDPGWLEGYLVQLLESPASQLRLEALQRIKRLNLLRLVTILEAFLSGSLTDSERRIGAETLAQFKRQIGENKTSADVITLAAGTASERELACQFMIRGIDSPSLDLLNKLCWDENPPVRRLAFHAAVRVKRYEFGPLLIEQLAFPLYAKAAATALTAIGQPVLPMLAMGFKRFNDKPHVLVQILKVVEGVGGREAEQLLLQQLDHPNRQVERQALISLGLMEFRANPCDEGILKFKINAMMKRMAFLVATRQDLGSPEELRELNIAVYGQVSECFENISLLLALICDARAIATIRDHMDGPTEQRAFATEIAREVVPPELRTLLMPVFEDLSPAQTLKQLEPYFPQPKMGRLGRIKALLRQGRSVVDHWTRTLALEALCHLEPGVAHRELLAHLYHDHPMIRQLAAVQLEKVGGTQWQRHQAHLGFSPKNHSGEAIAPPESLLHLEKLRVIKRSKAFAGVAEEILAQGIADIKEIQLESGQVLFEAGCTGATLFVIVDGVIRIYNQDRTLGMLYPFEFFGELGAASVAGRTASAQAAQPSRLLQIDRDHLFSMIGAHPEVMLGMVEEISTRTSF